MRIELTSQVRVHADVSYAVRALRRALRVLAPRIRTLLPRGYDMRRVTLSVVLVGETLMHRMNREYRGKDRATNVLSFSYCDDVRSGAGGGTNGIGENLMDGEWETVGEIFLCPSVIVREARKRRCSFRAWLSYLAVHGCLHIFGYDHESDREELEMERVAAKILGKTYPRKEEFPRPL